MSSTAFLLVACFWLCLAGVCYAYIGYPLVVCCLARWFGRRRHADFLSDEELPMLSLLIAAHNEEAVIDERVRNALALDYPA
ncbi:MAG TPA: hypothetical protein VH682_26320, partial [Gemmataceae bacterium]